MNTKLTKIKEKVVGLLEKLLFADAEVDVSQAEGAVKIDINSSQSALLIGAGGQNLDALQVLTGQMIYQDLEPNEKVSLDVNGYRAQAEEKFTDYIRSIAERVLSEKAPHTLEPMNSYQRRLVHTIISETSGLVTKSEGNEPYRYIIITPE